MFIKKKEWTEILTGLETQNKYTIAGESGEELYYVGEESSFLLRMLLRQWRPFTMHILSLAGMRLFSLKRVFKFFMQRMEIVDASGIHLGVIQQRFVWFARKFQIYDANGVQLFEIHGPFFRPWTFQIMNHGKEVGVISKKWSGLSKELFTTADNFYRNFSLREYC